MEKPYAVVINLDEEKASCTIISGFECYGEYAEGVAVDIKAFIDTYYSTTEDKKCIIFRGRKDELDEEVIKSIECNRMSIVEAIDKLRYKKYILIIKH